MKWPIELDDAQRRAVATLHRVVRIGSVLLFVGVVGLELLGESAPALDALSRLCGS